MTDRAFIDTNVFVYVHDLREPGKQARAREVLAEMAGGRMAPVASTQVVQEAYVALTRKLFIDPADARASLQQLPAVGILIQPVAVDTVWRATQRCESDRLSFWDALIVESAIAADCRWLYSEDLQSGRQFAGVTVVDPFADGSHGPRPGREINDRGR